ncbi:signal protein [Hyalangium rubrum]|uniref:Signal protein n=1 Tax=Hyalangium rubrum TaxID=3103134 RepID=A0ABU5H4N5_9BACT|nr:signal protein [Hyalangium sp. s54d21]MDY7228439.1 signal protein [Hyalangium sp. s54d21]
MSRVAQEDSKKRKWRNFLLEPRFQLKFTGYLMAVSLVLAALLGTFLFRNTQALLNMAGEAVESRSHAAEASRELSNATLSNELLKRMGDPVFAAQLESTSKEIDARFEAERSAVVSQRAELVRRQRLTWLAFGGTLAGFMGLIALVSIALTHRVAGPLMRIRRMVNDVASGQLRPPPYGLREKDELKDIFDATRGMIHVLRKQQEDDLLVLSHALERARQQGVEGEWVEDLKAMEARIKGRL